MTEKQKECERPGRDGGCGGNAAAEFFVCPVPCSVRPIVYDDSACIGCGRCAEVCQVDVLVPSLEKESILWSCFPENVITAGAVSWSVPCPAQSGLSIH